MKKNTFILILLCFLFCWQVHAQTVSKESAQHVAENFWRNQFPQKTQSSLSVRLFEDHGQPTMYAFSSCNGWVLVAGDQRMPPILAYSDDGGGTFPEDDMPIAMQYLLDGYTAYIKALRMNSIYGKYNPQWISYLNNNNSYPIRSIIVSPLLSRDGNENIWGQSGNNSEGNIDTAKVYNKFCPPRNNCAHTKTGCAATSVGQIMWYWQWPYAQKPVMNVNKVVCKYDWDLMPFQLTNESTIEEANMVATLLHDIGVEENMVYGCSESYAFPDQMLNALRYKFYYNADEWKDRDFYSDSSWFNMLQEELNGQRPVLYSGESMNESHAFVIDGYDSNNNYHLNLGLCGTGNGYYNLNNVFTDGQSMLTNIRPDYEFYCSPFLVPYTDVWPIEFTVQHGGKLTLWQMLFSNGMNGHIYSETSVKLSEGVYINLGARVYIGIKGTRCGDEQASVIEPRAIRKESHFIKTTNMSDMPSATKILRDGQLYIIRGESIYTINGIRIK